MLTPPPQGKPLNPNQSSRLLSVIIPARNEEKNLGPTVEQLIGVLRDAGIPFEIIVVDDNSSDETLAVAESLAAANQQVRVVARTRLGGFGRAVRAGLEVFRGDVVVITMADQSDYPADVVRYYRKIEEGFDCVFGSRFRRSSSVENYPPFKLALNRVVNTLIRLLFRTRFNDLTNAFKAYRREVIESCGPYSSSHFNLTIEMSLSALVRRYIIAEVPVSWSGRTWGSSSLSVVEMGRRYLSVLLKIYSESLLISDDILEERLAGRAAVYDRVSELEDRIANLELEMEGLQSAEELPPRSRKKLADARPGPGRS
jgi:dolichol-phosphate mannosyltransferase